MILSSICDANVIIGLTSLFGCLCMGFVCAVQINQLLAALQTADITPPLWEQNYMPQYQLVVRETQNLVGCGSAFAPLNSRLAI